MKKQSIHLALVLMALMVFTGFEPGASARHAVTQAPAQNQVVAGNQEVLDLLKAGMSPAVIIAKVKATEAKFDVSPSALQTLKTAGASDEIILAVIEVSTSKKEDKGPTSSKRRVTDELATKFKETNAVSRTPQHPGKMLPSMNHVQLGLTCLLGKNCHI